MLTIGQLASVAGVTPRAIRHYHDRGLLPEPVRDSSGYRRYDGQAVIDLIRIKTLAQAGVPLARVKSLLAASPPEFAAAIDALDADLAEQAERIQRHRSSIAALLAGDRLVLPDPVVDLLDDLRAAGASERAIAAERDGWTLLNVVAPQEALVLVAEKRAALADPAFRQVYLAFDEVAALDPADPRIEELAQQIVSVAQPYLGERAPRTSAGEPSELAVSLVASLPSGRTPAWERLAARCRELRERCEPEGAVAAKDRCVSLPANPRPHREQTSDQEP